MTTEEIIQGNKMISEFDGLTKDSYGKYFKNGIFKGYVIDEFKYHSSWDWIMPVVEKVKYIDNQADIEQSALLDKFKQLNEGEGNNIFETSIFCHLGEVYNRVIVLIQWYNDNLKNKQP